MRIIIYVSTAVTFLLAAIAVLLLGKAFSERQAIKANLQQTAESVSTALDFEVHAAIHLLRGLATSRALRMDDVEAFLEQMHRAPAAEGTWLALVDRWQYRVSTLKNYERLIPTPPGMLDFGSRDFKVTGLIVGKFSKRELVGISLAIRDEKGEVKYALNQSLSRSRLEAVVKSPAAEAGGLTVVLDGAGKMIAGAHASSVAPEHALAAANMPASDSGFVFFNVRSEITGWTVVSGVPVSVLNAPLDGAARNLIWIALGLVTLGMLGSFATARGFAQPIAELRRTARDTADLLHETEAQLNATETLYQTNWEHSAEALYVIRVYPSGRFEYVSINPALERLSGFKNADVSGKSPHECLPPAAAASVTAHYRQCVEKGQPIRYEQVLELPGGTRRWASQLVPVREHPGGRIKLLVGACRDITSAHQAQREIHDLSGRLLRLQEEERQRIAVELHDSTCQHLTAAGLNLVALRRKLNGNGSGKFFDDIENSLDEAQKEIRIISYLLYPAELEREGLKTALERYVKGFSQRSKLKTSLKVSRSIETISIELQRAVLRIVQEALANVYRHAEATKVAVTLQTKQTYLRIHVADDGKGFRFENRIEDEGTACGVGIPGMRTRLKQFGGRLRISRGAEITNVYACIPLTKLPRKTVSAVQANANFRTDKEGIPLAPGVLGSHEV